MVNNILVIGFTVAIIVYLFVVPPGKVPEIKTLRVVMLIWGLFVIYNNVRSLLPFNADGDFEFVGFALFLCSLGYLVARRSLRTEEALLAIRNELEIARRIQTSILPEQMPEMVGLRVAAKYVPMSEVAGDFYEFLVVDERRVGILIADVSGHGVPAALVASMVKVAIAAQAEHADDPAKVMSGLNSVLAGKLQGQFVTAAYLYLDLEKGTGSYSAAGHPPLFHYRATDQVIQNVVENGLILGIMPFASYVSLTLGFAKGDRFLLYTDGVVEADKAGEEFGRIARQRYPVGVDTQPTRYAAPSVRPSSHGPMVLPATTLQSWRSKSCKSKSHPFGVASYVHEPSLRRRRPGQHLLAHIFVVLFFGRSCREGNRQQFRN